MTRNIEGGRDALRALLLEPLRFGPVVEERRRGYRFTGAIALDLWWLWPGGRIR